MRAIIIDATKREVREADVDGKLKCLQEAVGGYVELVRISDSEDLYVNEEGLLHGETNFFVLGGFGQPLAGNGIIIGANQSKGTSKSTKFTVEQVKEMVTFMTSEEVKRCTCGKPLK